MQGFTILVHLQLISASNESHRAHAAAQDPACNRHMPRSGSWAACPESPRDRAAVGWGGQSISNAASPSSPNGFAGGRGRHARHDTQPLLPGHSDLSTFLVISEQVSSVHTSAFSRVMCIHDWREETGSQPMAVPVLRRTRCLTSHF